MSEVTPEPEATEPEADATPEPAEPTVEVDENGIPTVITDDFYRMGYEKVKSESETLVSVTAQIDAYQGNASALQEKFRETYGSDSDAEATDSDRKIADGLEKAKLAVLKLEEQRDKVINERIAAVTADAATAVGPLLEQQTKLSGTVKALRKVLTDQYGETATFGLPVVKGTRKSSGSSAGTGAPRIGGFDVYVKGVVATAADKDGNQRSNLAAAAKAANVDTSVMQQAFWTAQGTQDKEKFQSRVEFTVTDKDGNEYPVIAVKRVKTN